MYGTSPLSECINNHGKTNQDEDRLQALLDKAKGKEGINPVRKKLRKAIKALVRKKLGRCPPRNRSRWVCVANGCVPATDLGT